MIGCLQAALPQCSVNWDALAAICTLAATAVALLFGFRDIRDRSRRDRLLAGVLASSIQIRLGALIKGMEELHGELAVVVAGYDPSPKQLYRYVSMATANAERITRDEAVAMASVAPSLAGHLIAGVEGCGSILRMLEHAARDKVAPHLNEERIELVRVVIAMSDVTLAHFRTAFGLVREIATHQLTPLKPLVAPDAVTSVEIQAVAPGAWVDWRQ